MGQPLSVDLPVRQLAAVDDGMSRLAEAARFGVTPSTAIRWHAQQRDARDYAAKPRGGEMRSHRPEERASDILALWEERNDITRAELRSAMAQIGLSISVAGLHRFFVRRSMTRKRGLAWPSSKTGPTS